MVLLESVRCPPGPSGARREHPPQVPGRGRSLPAERRRGRPGERHPAAGRRLPRPLARRRGARSASVRLHLSALKSFYGYLDDRNLLDGRNPVERITAPRVRRRPNDRLPAREAEALLAACLSEQETVLIWLLRWTGLRVGEALGLTVEDVDLERRVIRVRASKTDAGLRTVPIVDELGVVLLRPTRGFCTSARSFFSSMGLPGLQMGRSAHEPRGPRGVYSRYVRARAAAHRDRDAARPGRGRRRPGAARADADRRLRAGAHARGRADEPRAAGAAALARARRARRGDARRGEGARARGCTTATTRSSGCGASSSA